jgi:archaellum component FlaC
MVQELGKLCAYSNGGNGQAIAESKERIAELEKQVEQLTVLTKELDNLKTYVMTREDYQRHIKSGEFSRHIPPTGAGPVPKKRRVK